MNDIRSRAPRRAAILSLVSAVLLALALTAPAVSASSLRVTPDAFAFQGNGAMYPLGIGTADNLAGDTVIVTWDMWLSTDCPDETKLFSWTLYGSGIAQDSGTVLETVDSIAGDTTHLTGSGSVVTGLPNENFGLLVSISSSCFFYSTTLGTTLGLVVVPFATPSAAPSPTLSAAPSPTASASPSPSPTAADPAASPTIRPTAPVTSTIATPAKPGSANVTTPIILLVGLLSLALIRATRTPNGSGASRRPRRRIDR